MQKNIINLLIVSVILIFVFGCFCRADKENENVQNTPPKAADAPKNIETKPSKITVEAGEKKDNGDFIVKKTELENTYYQEIDTQLKEDKVLEKAAAQFNRSLKLPFDISLQTKSCNEINAFYDPNEQAVTVCYELMEYYYKLFKAAGDTDDQAYDRMNNAVRFAFLHEVGHALIDAYKLPVTGGEEDAADRCSAYISLEEAKEGVKYVMAAADAFAIESKMSGDKKRNTADEHLLQEQRFFNNLCMIYGSNPDKYENIVSEGYLPKERAVRCPSEYQKNIQSWEELLKPWRKG